MDGCTKRRENERLAQDRTGCIMYIIMIYGMVVLVSSSTH